MKRILSAFLVLIICFSAFAGCIYTEDFVEGDNAKFDFSYEIEKDTYVRGEKIDITANVTNVSGKTYIYTGCSGNDFVPQISLYNSAGGQQYSISADPIVLPDDVVTKKVKNGEIGSAVYSFVIPDDVKLGKYSIKLSLGASTREFVDILNITEVAAQSNRMLKYDSTVISVRDRNINLIQTLIYTDEYSMDGELLICGYGIPFDVILSDNDAKLSDLPTLVVNEKFEILPHIHSKRGPPDIL